MESKVQGTTNDITNVSFWHAGLLIPNVSLEEIQIQQQHSGLLILIHYHVQLCLLVCSLVFSGEARNGIFPNSIQFMDIYALFSVTYFKKKIPQHGWLLLKSYVPCGKVETFILWILFNVIRVIAFFLPQILQPLWKLHYLNKFL